MSASSLGNPSGSNIQDHQGAVQQEGWNFSEHSSSQQESGPTSLGYMARLCARLHAGPSLAYELLLIQFVLCVVAIHTAGKWK